MKKLYMAFLLVLLAALLGVGDRLELSGRIQSRPYIKLIDGQPVEKTAYEVSVTDMEAV